MITNDTLQKRYGTNPELTCQITRKTCIITYCKIHSTKWSYLHLATDI